MKIRKVIIAIIQRVFGSALLFFGLNNIFGFMPLPQHEGFAQRFLELIASTGYIMPIIVAVQIGAGIALLVNRYVPLALILIFPISLNIFLFHLFHAQAALVPTTIFMVWNTVLVISRIKNYQNILLA